MVLDKSHCEITHDQTSYMIKYLLVILLVRVSKEFGVSSPATFPHGQKL